jgi:hypothetical protein
MRREWFPHRQRCRSPRQCRAGYHAQAGPIEPGNGFRYSGQQVKLVPTCYILVFPHFFAQRAVTVEEYSIQVTRKDTYGAFFTQLS